MVPPQAFFDRYPGGVLSSLSPEYLAMITEAEGVLLCPYM